MSNRARNFRELLDAIPDLDEDVALEAQDGESEVAVAASPDGAPNGAAAGRVLVRTEDVLVVDAPPPEVQVPDAPASDGPVPDGPTPAAPAVVGTGLGASRGAVARGRRRPPWWRRLAFAVATIVLVAAIPLLGREGYRLVVRSTDGKEISQTNDPTAPNFEEIVDSTPTMVMVQSGADGTLDSLTVVSLNSEEGGTVLFVPNMAELRTPAYGLGSLEMVYNNYWPKVDRAQQSVAHEVAVLLNVGIDEVVPVDDRSLAQLTEPVGSIAIDNPDVVTLPDGTVLPVGPIELTPEQIGPYLGFRAEAEDQLSQFERHQRVWRSWLNAVAASSDPGIVPGLTDQGVGRFVRALASGSVRYQVLPGLYDESGLFVIDDVGMNAALVDAVPVPDPPVPGARVLVRLLNGVEAGSPPAELVRTIVAAGGSVAVLGNGPSFDRDVTEIVYREETAEAQARDMLEALGATDGTIRLEPAAPDNFDLTVIVGRDVMDAVGGGT